MSQHKEMKHRFCKECEGRHYMTAKELKEHVRLVGIWAAARLRATKLVAPKRGSP